MPTVLWSLEHFIKDIFILSLTLIRDIIENNEVPNILACPRVRIETSFSSRK